MSTDQQSTNPLLSSHTYFPYKLIKIEHIPEAIQWLKHSLSHALEDAEAPLSHQELTWTNVTAPHLKMQQMVMQAWAPITHLFAVDTSDALTAEIMEAQKLLVPIFTQTAQSKKIYQKHLDLIAKHQDTPCLTDDQLRSLNLSIKGQRLSGVHLEDKQQQRLKEINLELSHLSTQFRSNCNNANKAYQHIIKDASHLCGLPESEKERFSKLYQSITKQESTPQKGPWLIQLDSNSYTSILKHCDYAPLRKKIFLDRITLVSQGEYDNTQIIQNILKLRSELSQILGFQHYAEQSLYSKMAGSVEDIQKLQSAVEDACQYSAQKDHKLVTQMKHEITGSTEELQDWDRTYWYEQYHKKHYQYDEEKLKEYFPLTVVMDGLKKLILDLFGVDITPKNLTPNQIWNEDVQAYDVVDQDSKESLGTLYFDPYARPGTKNEGAWMNPAKNRYKDNAGKMHLPIAYVVCNFTPPSTDRPSLLRFSDVITLFHEFGHALQQLLTEINIMDISGTNVEWDAVELPSQFMENWCYHRNTLQRLAQHYKTKENLPDELYHKIINSKNFANGYFYLRQIGLGRIDLDLHSKSDIDLDHIYDYYKRLLENIFQSPDYPEKGKGIASFSHIFAGGYAAGYYSYLWARVMSDDAFSKFEDAGLDDEDAQKVIGTEFRNTVLALGGSIEAKDVFRKFRGRDPQIHALLRYAGLKSAAKN